METNIGIASEHLSEVAKSLSRLLADEFILYTETRNAHWNIEGPDFHVMHIFFEEQYEKLDEVLDAVAERIRMLGHYAPATMAAYLSLTHLTEESHEKKDSLGLITKLLQDHESIIRMLREDIARFANDFYDFGTSDFVTSLMETHESMAWKLRSHLKRNINC
jgi:starvation-inducible DNA-binding protein